MTMDLKREYPVGTTVELVSGGPLMTVVKVHVAGDTRDYRCAWFVDGCRELRDTVLPEGALRPVERSVERGK